MTEVTRRFLMQTTAAAVATSALHSSVAIGAPQRNRLKLGFIGCGGRAQFARKTFP